MINTSFFIPEEMRRHRSWVLWRLEQRNGNITKVPYSINGRRAATDNPSTWANYEDVCYTLKAERDYYNGVGFVLTHDNVVFVDIDHCIMPDGSLSETARDILHILGDTFAEVSQSGTGLHIFARGEIPRSFKNSKTGVEMYDGGRYCAITGNAINAIPIADNQEGLICVFEKYKTADAVKTQAPCHITPLSYLSDERIVKKCCERSNLFVSLYDGNYSMYGSHSEADFAMCLLLAFWADRNADIIDRIFRSSGLMRGKWNRDDYRHRTIDRACSQCQESLTEYKERRTREGVEEYGRRFLNR